MVELLFLYTRIVVRYIFRVITVWKWAHAEYGQLVGLLS